MLTFACYPVLVLIAPVIAWAWYRYTGGSQALIFSRAHSATGFTGDYSTFAARVPLLIRTCALIFLVIAMARPQLANVSRNVRSPGVDIILCIDTSGTMQALDFKLRGERVSRLTAVQKVVTEFIQKREYDRIGLVVFGQEAFTQAPLTMDKGLLLSLVNKMKIGMAGDTTAIGSAIAISGKRLKELEARSKILILLTDGRNNAGSITPEEAADAVHAFGVRIYTIGIGGTGPAPFPVQTPFGTRLVRQQVDLDEETLQKIASIGEGKYFRASDSKELSEIYDIIDRAEKTEIDVKEFFHFDELYLYFLIPAILLFMLETVLISTVLRVIP